MVNTVPTLSIVICTYNRAQLLEKALDALVAQTQPHDGSWEVVVINNNCTDDTEALITNYSGRLPGLRSVAEVRQGLTEARQRGFLCTESPWVAFVDDDCLVGSGWVANAIRFIAQGVDIAAFNGFNELKLELEIGDSRPWVTPIMFAADNPGTDIPVLKPVLHGAGLVLNRCCVMRSGWLDNPRAADRTGGSLVSGGDNELAIRAAAGGGALWHVPAMRMKHVVSRERLVFSYLVRLNFRLAEANPMLIMMGFSGPSWPSRLAFSAASQAARSVGLLHDNMLGVNSGIRGRLLALTRGFGFLAGVFKLVFSPAALRREVIGLATPARVQAMDDCQDSSYMRHVSPVEPP